MEQLDLSERQRVEAALRASEAQLRLALDVAELGTWTWDLASGAGEIDSRGAAIVGLPAGRITNIAAAQRERVHPDDLARLEADISAGITRSDAFDLTYRVIYPDGSLHHIVSRAQVLRDAAGVPIQLSGTNRDVTRERETELELRAREAHTTFLVRLTDELRALDNAEAILFTAASMLGEHLGASRVGYAEALPDGETIVVTRNYTRGVPGIEGHYRYNDYGPELLEAFRIGRTVVRPDVANDPNLTSAEKAAHARLHLGATVNVPVLKAGRLVGVLFMHQDEARAWAGDEVALLEAIATRTWDAVERARVETALRESEERYRTLLKSIEQGYARFEMLYDGHNLPVDYRFLEVNGTFERHTGLRDPVGKTARELVPNLEAHWFEIYGRVAASGTALQFEQGSLAMGRLFEVEAVRVGAPERRQVAVLFTDVTERRRDSELRAAAAARDQYLVRLADTLRPLADAATIEGEASRVLGEQLGVNRVAYFEVQGRDYVVTRDYVAGAAPIAGRFPIAAFGQRLLAAYQSGRPVIEPDVAVNTALSPDERAAFAAIQIGAYVGVPLIKGGAFVAGLAVHNASPRAWTADEVALVEETAERTWAAVERARVEQALREREEQLQAALEGGQLGAWAWNPATNQSQVDGVTLELFGLDLDQPAVDVASVFAQIHPEDLPAVAAALAAVQQPGGEYRAEFRVRLPDGRERWIAGLGRGRFENGTVQRVYGVNFDITSRKRAEADTRLLAQLGARISVAEDAEALQEGVVRLVGEHLQVAHCCFAEIDVAHDRWFVRHEWYDRTLSLAGDRRISDYPPAFVETLQRGELLICADATLDPLATTRYTQAYAPIGARAYVVVPLLRQRQWVSTLMVLQPSPREWKEAEIALLQTVAERTWQAVERARAERALRESEARLQLALDSTGMGTFVWHLAEDRAEPDVRLLAHFGLPPDSTTSPSEALATLVYLEDRAPYAAAVQRATDPDGDGRLYAEVRAMQPDGSLRWLAVIGQTFFDGMPRQALRVAGMIGDISERKQIEARLAAAAVRDQYLVRLADALRPLSNASAIEAVATRVLGEQLGATRVAYFEVDGEDYVASHYYSVGVESPAGRFSSTSFGPEQLATYRAGRTVIEPDVAANPTLTPADRETYATYQIAAHVGVPLVKDRRFVAGLAVHQTTPRAWTADEVALIEETAERTWAAIERARAEARLQALFAQEQAARRAAEEASRLKDEFLATVSHELRTPLTAFLGYASLLQRRQRDEAYVRRAVEKMVQSAQAQAALIEDLLDVSRVIGGKLRIEPEPIELIDVVHAALDTVRPTLESRGLTLDLALDPAASAVFGDASRLQQVVWNLLSNAAKFSRAGGRITVQLTRVADDAELSVHDTGQGIDPVFLPFVFDRFRQADSTSQRVHGGLGLGLAIVRHLVELHGGTVMASSAGVGQGATFIVRLPLAMTSNQQELRSAMDTASAEVVHTALLPLRGVQVLVVDDQPAILELLEELLTTDGATVRACSSTAEALALVDEWRPDVLVSDIAMPGEDGYQLIEQLRSRPVDAGGSIPAVALTAYVRMEDRLRVLAAGFQQYVTKPVDAAELRDVILHLITTRQEPSSASQ